MRPGKTCPSLVAPLQRVRVLDPGPRSKWEVPRHRPLCGTGDVRSHYDRLFTPLTTSGVPTYLGRVHPGVNVEGSTTVITTTSRRNPGRVGASRRVVTLIPPTTEVSGTPRRSGPHSKPLPLSVDLGGPPGQSVGEGRRGDPGTRV